VWLSVVLGTAGMTARLPEREVLTAARWIESSLSRETGAGAPRHLLLCDIASAVHPDADGADRCWAGIQLGGGPVLAPEGARGLLLNHMNIDVAHEDEFNDWYDTEHLPRIAGVEGVIAARRFRSDTDSPRYLATYHLRDLDVIGGDAWKSAASTPWTARMRRHRTGLIRLGFVAPGALASLG
jgi:hypothetical protein